MIAVILEDFMDKPFREKIWSKDVEDHGNKINIKVKVTDSKILLKMLFSIFFVMVFSRTSCFTLGPL